VALSVDVPPLILPYDESESESECKCLTCNQKPTGKLQIKSNQKHIYKSPYVAGESEAHSGRERLGRVFTFTIGNVKQLSEFQTEGALTVNAFANNTSVIFSTKSNNLSDDRNVCMCSLVLDD